MTILFADVAGSTALGEQLDPERLRGRPRFVLRGDAPEIETEGGSSRSSSATRSSRSSAYRPRMRTTRPGRSELPCGCDVASIA